MLFVLKGLYVLFCNLHKCMKLSVLQHIANASYSLILAIVI